MADGQLVAVDRETQQAIAWRYLQRSPCDVLAEPCPCDDCPLRARCAAERLACDAFARFAKGWVWRRATREPTRELYTLVMGDDSCDEPDTDAPAAPAEPPQAPLADRAQQWVGRAVGARTVAGWGYNARGEVRLYLHCHACGRDAIYDLYHVTNGTVSVCVCESRRAVADAKRGKPQAYVAGVKAARRAATARAAARRARRAESDRIDARMRESERADAAGATP